MGLRQLLLRCKGRGGPCAGAMGERGFGTRRALVTMEAGAQALPWPRPWWNRGMMLSRSVCLEVEDVMETDIGQHLPAECFPHFAEVLCVSLPLRHKQ